MDIGERIFQLRNENNLSQEQMAERLDISRQAISKWESGQSTPELDKIIQLSELFGITTDYLLKGKETQNNNLTAIEKKHIREKSVIPYAVLSTGVNLIGMVLMLTLGEVIQMTEVAAIGLVIQIIGVIIFEIAVYFQKSNSRYKYVLAHIRYYALNNWFLLFIPVCRLTADADDYYFRFLADPFKSYSKPYITVCIIVTCLLVITLFILRIIYRHKAVISDKS